jgi:TIR domain
MPLDDIARRYADKIFQEELETIRKNSGLELVRVRQDFARRNTTMSGGYFSAQATVLVNQAELFVKSRVDSLLRAYERSGIPLDDVAFQEITNEATQCSEQQGGNIVATLQNQMGQVFGAQGGDQGMSSAIAGHVVREMSGVSARIVRRLSIMRDEVILDEKKSKKVYAAGLGKKWDVFISHASEDKDEFVRPLANALEVSGLAVWYDESTLRVGDRLREAIDNGLARSRYGVVVLSRYFFAKQWPREELEGLTTKEVGGVKVILPVWHNILADEVKGYSPTLAGRFAARSDDGLNKVVRDLRAAMGL